MMDAGISCRRALPDDAPALAALRYEFRSQFGTVVEDEAAFVARCTEWMRARLKGDVWLVWVAEFEGQVIGQLWLQPMEKIPNPVRETELHAYITNAFVRPEYRSAGLGSKLLRLALAWCQEAGVDRVILWPSERSRPLYQRHGFTADNELMELQLPVSP